MAKQLATKLGYVYIDTGAMYRAVTWYAMENHLITDENFNKEALLDQLNRIALTFQFNPAKGFAEVYLNGENIEANIRSLAVSKWVSEVAAIPEVRKMLVQQQHQMGRKKGIVMDGRDIGTVVFPAAELKIFMTASAKTRAERRFKELKENGEEVAFEAVLKNIQERDYIDSTRKDSPLKKAPDAVLIDNSTLGHQEQFERLLSLAQNKINTK